MKSILQKTIAKVLFMLLLVFSATNSNAQVQLAGWTFDTAYTLPTVTPNTMVANLGAQSGVATIYANGTNGASTWITAATGNELTSFAGNVLNDPRTTTVAGSSYAPVGGTANSANGKSIVVKLSTTGYQNPILTYATRNTTTGFQTQQWAWSTDGSTFTNITPAITGLTTTFAIKTIDLTAIDAVDNVTDLYLRVTFTGASAATGNNRVDNIMVNATAVGASGPSVTTNLATLVTTTSATLNGSINANGVSTDTSFEYGLTTSYGSTITGSPASVNTSVSEAITASLSSLSPNTLYNFRAVGTVASVPTNGGNNTFTTLANVPSSPVVTNPTLTSLDVTIGSGDGNPATTSYAIRVNGTQYVQADGTLGVSAVWQTAAIWATKTVTGLTENTSYSFDVKARNSAFVETAFSSATNLSTPASIVAPIANLANDVTQTSFVANWSSVPTATSYGLDVSDSPTFSTTGVTSNLIISEYGEGSVGTKKYIEIYNGTGADVDLANYQIWKNVNGSNWNFNSTNTTPSAPLSLSGTLASGDTYVIANNTAGEVIGADLYTSFLSFNGDDATGLAYNGGSGTVFAIIDGVGVSGVDPGTAWAVAGVNNATADKILIRKPTVLSPTTNWSASAGTTVANSEWIVSSFTYNSNTQTTDLGIHSVSQPSFLPGYENLLVSGTSQTVTGLTLDTTYYYRVRASNAFNTSANSNVVSVLTASPQNVTEIISPLCGSTLSSMSQLVQVRNFTPSKQITGYRYKIEGSAGFLQIIEKTTPHFDFRTVTGWEYGKTYTVSCELQKSGVWYGFYGPTCSISTPNVVAAGLSQIVSPTCDTVVTPNTIIASTSLGGVTGYLFRVTNTTPGYAGANTVQTKERTPHWFRLNMLDEYVYGSTYTVEVAVKTSGAYGAFGPVCTFTTTIPVIAQCGTTVNVGSLISSTSLGGVTQYAYQVTNLSDSSVQNIVRTSPNFSTNLITGYSSTTSYSVSVAVTSTGVQSPYSLPCVINASPEVREINTSYASELKVQAFPNPFTNNFTLDITRASEEKVAVMVYDMIGKLLDRVDVNATENSLELGANYPAGVYNVIVSQGEKLETVRMVKR